MLNYQRVSEDNIRMVQISHQRPQLKPSSMAAREQQCVSGCAIGIVAILKMDGIHFPLGMVIGNATNLH